MKMSLPLSRTAGPAIFVLLVALFATAGLALTASAGNGMNIILAGQSGAGAQIPLNPSHPDRYVVKRGDTLWDISGMFLRDPWYWPEIWHVNPQVANPHLIYPGDVLTLVYVDGRPQIQLERGGPGQAQTGGDERLSPRVRSEDLDAAIDTIPFDLISAFLSKGSVLEKDEIKKLPYIVALRDGHMIGAAGMDVYVRGDVKGQNHGYSVVHVGEKLIDPDDGDVVGYEGVFVGEGIIDRFGDPSTLALVKSQREAMEGDRLVVQDFHIPLQFYPRAPDQPVSGRIIHVNDSASIIGQYYVVVLNRGARDGLEEGHVLSVLQAGSKVKDRVEGGSVRLPDEQAGHLMVFKVYDRISYALIMEATSDIHVLDKVVNPG
jgi:hypothetical protein